MENVDIAATKNPLLVEFVGLVDEITSDGIPDFADISSPPFMKFWRHFIIHRYDAQLADFRTILYGSHIVEIYGHDCTGMLLSEMGFGEAEDMVREMNKRCLDNRERIFATNSLFWQDREHRIYHQVKMPLRRNGEINEVLVCMTFDSV